MELTLAIHAFTCFFMTGLCWFVQLVHYPLFRQIRMADFPEYERKNFATAWITVPTMVVEMLTGLYLLYLQQDLVFLTNIILFGLIGLSTLFFQVPTHLQLARKGSRSRIDFLIRTNWIRTLCWTIRSGLIGLVLVEQLGYFRLG